MSKNGENCRRVRFARVISGEPICDGKGPADMFEITGAAALDVAPSLATEQERRRNPPLSLSQKKRSPKRQKITINIMQTIPVNGLARAQEFPAQTLPHNTGGLPATAMIALLNPILCLPRRPRCNYSWKHLFIRAGSPCGEIQCVWLLSERNEG